MKPILLTGLVCALMTSTSAVSANIVITKTKTQSVDIENVKEIPFSEFDVNGDGSYSRKEVGERLFSAFDRDGNQVIDNNEWDMKSVYTVIPMKSETYKFVDKDGDGYIENSSYTYQTFFEESGLIRFDKNRDGLSPKEFISKSFQSLDDDDNNMILLDEWEEAYEISVRPKSAEPERYN